MDCNYYRLLLNVECAWLSGIRLPIPSSRFCREVNFQGSYSVIENIKNLLKVVDGFGEDEWTDLEKLVALLPAWFLEACSEPMSIREEEGWLSTWRKLHGEEKEKFAERKGWSAIDWIYWLHPQQRNWFIASSVFHSEAYHQCTLITSEWLVPLDAFMWALRSAGAVKIEVRDVQETRA